MNENGVTVERSKKYERNRCGSKRYLTISMTRLMGVAASTGCTSPTVTKEISISLVEVSTEKFQKYRVIFLSC